MLDRHFVANNQAAGSGGGPAARGLARFNPDGSFDRFDPPRVTVRGALIQQNTAQRGGGVSVFNDGILRVEETRFLTNSAGIKTERRAARRRRLSGER